MKHITPPPTPPRTPPCQRPARGRHLATLTLVAALATAPGALPGATPAPPAADRATALVGHRALAGLDSAIRARLDGAAPEALSADAWARVRALYAARAHRPLWLADDGRPGPRARELVTVLLSAERQGLRLGDYPVAALDAALAAAEDADDAARAGADVLLTATFAELAADLLTGRTDPRQLEAGWHIPTRAFDVDSAVARALDARGSVAAGLAGLRPSHEGYDALVVALARYRQLAADGGWPTLPDGPTFRPGDTAATHLPVLRHRLAAEGFLAEAPAAPAPPALANALPGVAPDAVYDLALAGAVARFQARHGLAVDSAVGPRTRQALNVTAATRARQLEANLERLRWLPPELGQRRVVVNVPAFRLDAYSEGQRALTMRVVVGDELASRRTPIFADSMRYVQFGPYWNVPRSIAVNEILPIAARDRAYLTRNQFEIVRGWGDDAPVVSPWALSDAALYSTRYRVRQRPGPQNALGRVKFMFPNDYAVYLHDTPAQALFDDARRAASHGCVRVADPAALAAFVLHGDAAWMPARIQSALATGERVRVDLARPLPVYLVYLTAFARGGEVHFRDDIYDRDARLVRALGNVEPAPEVAGAAERLARRFDLPAVATGGMRAGE